MSSLSIKKITELRTSGQPNQPSNPPFIQFHGYPELASRRSQDLLFWLGMGRIAEVRVFEQVGFFTDTSFYVNGGIFGSPRGGISGLTLQVLVGYPEGGRESFLVLKVV